MNFPLALFGSVTTFLVVAFIVMWIKHSFKEACGTLGVVVLCLVGSIALALFWLSVAGAPVELLLGLPTKRL